MELRGELAVSCARVCAGQRETSVKVALDFCEDFGGDIAQSRDEHLR